MVSDVVHLDLPLSAFLVLSSGLMRRHSLFRKKKTFTRKLRIIQLVIRYVFKVLSFGFSLDHIGVTVSGIMFHEYLLIFKKNTFWTSVFG